MRFKILGLFAAMSVLAACSSNGTGQSGGTTQATSSGPTSALSPQQELTQQVGDRIFYDFNKSSISPEAQGTLERQAAFMKKYPQLTFTVAGNCDDRGTREYNLALGERRATADVKGLAALGVDGGRLKTISYGKERPSVVGENEAAWQQNRNAITTIN